jgi:hypothetical protein
MDLPALLADLKILDARPVLDGATGAMSLIPSRATVALARESPAVAEQLKKLAAQCAELRVELRHHLAPKCRACGRPFWCREDRERVVGANPFCQRVPCPMRRPQEEWDGRSD